MKIVQQNGKLFLKIPGKYIFIQKANLIYYKNNFKNNLSNINNTNFCLSEHFVFGSIIFNLSIDLRTIIKE